MKYIISALTSMLLVIAAISPNSVFSREESSPGFYYTIINGRATVTGFIGEPEVIEIPAELEGCPVTEVRDNAFYCCSSLREMTLPDSITKLGHHCFYRCDSLESVTLPSALEVIGMGCFSGCSTLTSINIPDTLTLLPDSCFRDCSALTGIYLPISVRSVEKFCFSGCSALETVVFGEETSDIGEYAFYMCPKLKKVYIPPSVSDIGEMSFGFTLSCGESIHIAEFAIYGEKGSAAQSYAKECGIDFSAVSGQVQAFAQQSSSGRSNRLPLPFIIVGAVLFAAAAVLTARQSRRND